MKCLEKSARLHGIVCWLESLRLQHTANTRLQSAIQVVFYNSESQRKRTSEAALESPTCVVQAC